MTLDHVVPAPSRRRAHVGEPRHGVQVVQPPQGRQDARGGPAAPAPAAVRAAQRHLLAVHAVPRRREQRGVADLPVPGTELTAATPEATIRAAIPAPVRDLLVDALGGRPRRVRRRGLAARRGAGPAGRGLGPRVGRAARAGPRAAARRGLREPVRDGRGPPRRPRSSRSRPSAPTTTTPTSGGRTGSSSATPSSSTSRAATSPATRWRGERSPTAADAPGLVDPYDGAGGHRGSPVLRAVGDPRRRFEEDALRMVRAVRLAATLGFEVEAATLAGIQARADLVRHLSGERIATELDKLLAAERPSIGLRLLADTGLLTGISPELAAQRGHPAEQGRRARTCGTTRSGPSMPRRPPGRSSGWRRSSMTSASRRRSPTAISSATTRSGRTWPGRSWTGCARRGPSASAIVHLVRNHMFSYESNWSDAAVRRFIAKMTLDGAAPEALDELFELRAADNVGSGLPADAGGLDELRARVAAALLEGRGPRPARPRRRRPRPDDRAGPRARSAARPDPRRAAGARPGRPGPQRPAEPAAPRAGHAGGRLVIELLLEAERAMEMGRIDAAETLYRQVAEPTRATRSRSVGLARVDARTRRRAWCVLRPRSRRSPSIPENAAAQRMVDPARGGAGVSGANPWPEPERASDTPAPAPDDDAPRLRRRPLIARPRLPQALTGGRPDTDPPGDRPVSGPDYDRCAEGTPAVVGSGVARCPVGGPSSSCRSGW